MSDIMEDRLWSLRDLAQYLDVPVKTIYQWRYRGEGPPGLRIGGRIRYRPSDVRAWLETCEDRST